MGSVFINLKLNTSGFFSRGGVLFFVSPMAYSIMYQTQNLSP